MSKISGNTKVYIGGLGKSPGAKEEIEKVFLPYGPIKYVWVARRPPGFAFVEFIDARDAEDAVRMLNGASLWGRQIYVAIAKSVLGGRSRSKQRGRYSRPSSRSRSRSRSRSNCARSSKYRRSRTSRSRSPRTSDTRH